MRVNRQPPTVKPNQMTAQVLRHAPDTREMTNAPPRSFARACREIIGWIVLAAMSVCFNLVSAQGLDPSQPPGNNFDLSHWKLTLPDLKATEIPAVELDDGYTNALFFNTGLDGAMVFWSPVTGGVTGEANYPRSELREMLVPDNENVNWSGYGTNILNAQCRVTEIPSSKMVIIGQIHGFTGNALPLVKLQFNDSWVEALVKNSPNADSETTFLFGNIGLSNLITYQIKLENGLLSMTVNGSNRTVNVFQTDPAWANQAFFFKAGSYCQDNTGPATEGSRVAFYQLSVSHAGLFTPAPVVVLTNCAVNAGNYSFSVVGDVPGNYFVQTSTDLENWEYLLVTNSIPGQFQVVDAMTPGRRFYRGGLLTGILLMNGAADGAGQYRFTVIGPGAGNYFIQSSTNLENWGYRLFTNSATGWFEFSEPISPGAHFYRSGTF